MRRLGMHGCYTCECVRCVLLSWCSLLRVYLSTFTGHLWAVEFLVQCFSTGGHGRLSHAYVPSLIMDGHRHAFRDVRKSHTDRRMAAYSRVCKCLPVLLAVSARSHGTCVGFALPGAQWSQRFLNPSSEHFCMAPVGKLPRCARYYVFLFRTELLACIDGHKFVFVG